MPPRPTPADRGATEGSFFKIREQLRPTVSSAPVGLWRSEPGAVIGDFRLISLIGQGGMGQVWEAEQISLRRRVALKFVRPERVTPRYVSYFEREARAGGRMTHPGIVTIYGFGSDQGIAWIAMELVEGCWTLRDYLDDARFLGTAPEAHDRSVARLVAQIAEALQFAHDHGVVHRDLKPQNLLITAHDQPKVTDFGLARILDESGLSETGEVVGTYYYMSPEQVAARRMGLDHRTDIFTLGVVLYEMLTLRRPFEGDTTQQIAQQILLHDPPDMRSFRSRVSRDMVVICQKAMQKDPDKRYPTMAEFGADLERYLAGESIHARPPTAIERSLNWVKRNPARSSAAAMALSAFVVISGLSLRIASQNDDLRAANTALEARTAEARRRTEDVFRLSLSENTKDLMAEAAALWPAHPERIDSLESWISRAENLCGELGSLVAKRDELRALALPRTEDERRLDREGHPDFASLVRAQGELVSRGRTLAQRRDGQRAPSPQVNWSEFPPSAAGLEAAARSLVDPQRTSFGDEPLGAALAERALELAAQEELSTIAGTLSQAYFELGRDEEALALAFLAVEEAPQANRAGREAALSALEQTVAEVSSAAGQAAEAAQLAHLEVRVAELERRVGERRTWTFPEDSEARTQTRWWHSQLSELIEALELLKSPGRGLLTEQGVSPDRGWSVPRRLTFARHLQAGFAPGGDFARRWEEALPEIRAAYPSLEVAPQMGLVPIGPDPASRLWEFWHVQSGTEPVRDEDGRLAIDAGSGLVLVLLPGGSFWMGGQSGRPEGRNYDKGAAANEGPVHELELDAFFLSKYEMTQGQWERTTGNNPSRWTEQIFRDWVGGAHPVEQTSWLDCVNVVRMLGLDLPSEARWEYGCRAGTASVRPFAFEAFATSANVADQSAKQVFTGLVATEAWDDGWGAHAHVGRLAPNAFGLHDMLGNVWEWCLDGYDRAFYGASSRANPVSPAALSASRVYRGGSFNGPADLARSANRDDHAPSNADDTLGLRPARALSR